MERKIEQRKQTEERAPPVERRLQTDRAHAVGRDGEVLTRKRGAGSIDQFDIPSGVVPPGWKYQWNTVSIYNNRDVLASQALRMHEAGWRPVPADRHPGLFTPVGTKGEILRDGMRLDERPLVLDEEARDEQENAARRLISDRNDALKLSGMKKDMPQGFEMNRNKYRKTGGDVRISIDRNVADIPTPSHQLANPED